MATVAIQVDFLLSGCRKKDGSVNSNGRVYFFSAGTTNTKTVYKQKDISNPSSATYDTVTAGAGEPHPGEEYVKLDSNGFPVAESGGLAEVYADGTYDIYVYDSSNVLQYTISDASYVVPFISSRSGSYHSTGPVTVDGSMEAYYFDTTAGNIAVNINFDASSVSAGTNITFMIVNGDNSITITPNTGGTIGGQSTWTITGANTICRIESDGTNNDWGIASIAEHNHRSAYEGGYLPLIIEQRSKFTYNGGTTAFTIKMSAARYSCKDKLCFWDSEITSNAASSTIADTWYYLYIDYSTVTEGTALTASNFYWSSSAPSWDGTYKAYMNGDDRCIFAARTNSGNTDFLGFSCDGDLMQFYDQLLVVNAATPSNNWTEYNLKLPSFASNAQVIVSGARIDSDSSLLVRNASAGGYSGHRVGRVTIDNEKTHAIFNYLTSNGNIACEWDNANSNEVAVYCMGWKFPIGM